MFIPKWIGAVHGVKVSITEEPQVWAEAPAGNSKALGRWFPSRGRDGCISDARNAAIAGGLDTHIEQR